MFLVLFNSLLLAKKLHSKTKIQSKSDSFEDQLKWPVLILWNDPPQK